MKILVLSSTPWDEHNSFGNTYSNLFSGFSDIEFANIFCKAGNLHNSFPMTGFRMTEKSLLLNLLGKCPAGECVTNRQELSPENGDAKPFVPKKRRLVYFWIREWIWRVGRWKSPELRAFIQAFQPDLIFQPIYYNRYLNRVAQYVKRVADVPMLGYVSDDVYHLQDAHGSPLQKLDILLSRRCIKKTVENCEILYVVSELQKREYAQVFTPPCKVLTKCADFTEPPQFKTSYNTPLQLVFTGNIGTNRWKSLAILAQAVQDLNRNGTKAELRIYTATPLTAKMQKALQIDGASYLMGAVPASEMPRIQSEADMLVHVEAMDIKNKLAVRQSFSTKLVDYFKAARPILAVGPKDVASIDHLLQNNCALVADNEAELTKILSVCIENPSLLDTLAENAYICGKRCHDAAQMKEMLYADLKNTVASRN